jgi:hypothetical protein|mmetsp:Transcript_40781/g.66707  ORF Transcript_40781/g.66707 Transcript_40781/m.66707 type:complete len:81 (-) Transcript_40781:1329-1571(-)
MHNVACRITTAEHLNHPKSHSEHPEHHWNFKIHLFSTVSPHWHSDPTCRHKMGLWCTTYMGTPKVCTASQKLSGDALELG